MYKLGIDVGGTNTDAVVLDDQLNVITSTKTHTTKDVATGIKNAIHEAVSSYNIDPAQISQAMLGTTQATNAIVERKNLGKVGVLRIGYPATASILPYTEWPADISKILSNRYALIHGGYEFNGDPIVPFSEKEVLGKLAEWKNQIDSLAVVGVFSSINDDQERRVVELAHEVLGDDFPVSTSSSIGSIGLIGRENATILNAALNKVIKNVTNGFSSALIEENIVAAKKYLCQNDGTLMSIEYAAKYPILTIGSGPTNSIRGAAYLSKLKNALTIDIGGTTSDIGVLSNGFPRESSKAVRVGGVRTNFRMPDVLSVGLGGGTIVRVANDGNITIGPDSVGYAITDKAIAFGGDTLTTTDIAVRLGLCQIGNPKLVEKIPLETAREVMKKIAGILEDGIDQMKTSAEDVNVILVGGGAIIAPPKLNGVKRIIKNKFGDVANAIGATIANIGGEYEKVYQYAQIERTAALADVKKQATSQAILAGAKADSIKVVEITEVPLAYAPGDTTRVKAKVVGTINNTI